MTAYQTDEKKQFWEFGQSAGNRLKGVKTAIVTGAGSGIGAELALELGASGISVAVTDINGERAEKVAEKIRTRGGDAESFTVDHSDSKSVQDFKTAYQKSYGEGVGALFLNAGIGFGGEAHMLSEKDWKKVSAINVDGALHMLELFLPEMVSAKRGYICVTASGLGLMGMGGLSPYCLSKFAMVGLVESLRPELHRYGIKVSALCPGIIATDIVNASPIDSSLADRTAVNELYAKFGASPRKVAKDAIIGLAKNKAMIVTPFNTHAIWLMKRWFPTSFDFIARIGYSLYAQKRQSTNSL